MTNQNRSFFGFAVVVVLLAVATRVCVLLFVCVVVFLHINAVGFSFRKSSPVVMHFSPTLFCFFSFFYLENNCRFLLPFLLMIDVVVVLLVAGCCCGVLWWVSFVITVMFCYCDLFLRFAVVVYCCGLLLWFFVVVCCCGLTAHCESALRIFFTHKPCCVVGA